MPDTLPEISASEAIRLVGTGTYLIDVREQDEWDKGHAAGAHFVPMSRLGDLVDDIPKDRQVLVVCHSGGRSARVTRSLITAGYDAVNVAGGSSAWAAADGPLESDGSGAARIE